MAVTQLSHLIIADVAERDFFSNYHYFYTSLLAKIFFIGLNFYLWSWNKILTFKKTLPRPGTLWLYMTQLLMWVWCLQVFQGVVFLGSNTGETLFLEVLSYVVLLPATFLCVRLMLLEVYSHQCQSEKLQWVLQPIYA